LAIVVGRGILLKKVFVAGSQADRTITPSNTWLFAPGFLVPNLPPQNDVEFTVYDVRMFEDGT
jgi:hypothetical protein